MEVHLYAVLIPVVLLLAAFFAASEAALFSLSRTQLEQLKETHPKVFERIQKLVFSPDALLSTIIIGNEGLNILIGTFIAALLQTYLSELATQYLVILSVLISSLLLLMGSEILPKVVAFRAPVKVASLVCIPMAWAHTLLGPFRTVFLSVSGGLLSFFGISSAPPSVVSEKEFLTMVEVGAESGSLELDEKEMISNVFQFTDSTVTSIMTPWKEVYCVPESLEAAALLDRIRIKNFSRIPVLKNRKQITGVLYTKDLLKLLLANKNPTQKTTLIKKAIRTPYIVPSSRKVSRLFREFKQHKVHIAIVVDEFGTYLGIVTLDDILNLLFQTQANLKAQQI